MKGNDNFGCNMLFPYKSIVAIYHNIIRRQNYLVKNICDFWILL